MNRTIHEIEKYEWLLKRTRQFVLRKERTGKLISTDGAKAQFIAAAVESQLERHPEADLWMAKVIRVLQEENLVDKPSYQPLTQDDYIALAKTCQGRDWARRADHDGN